MSMQTRGNRGYMLSRIISPEEGESETMKLCARILGHPEPPSIYSYLATLELREALEVWPETPILLKPSFFNVDDRCNSG